MTDFTLSRSDHSPLVCASPVTAPPGLTLAPDELRELLAGAPLSVVLQRHPHGWWSAALDDLDCDAVGQGADDALVRLGEMVRRRVRQVFDGASSVRDRALPVAIRAWLEDCEGRLGAALAQAAIIENDEYDISASEPLFGVPEVG